jgi:hypothetical protein
MANLPVPYTKAFPTPYLKFSIDPDNINWGDQVTKIEMIGMLNSGYVVEATITDAQQRLLTKFTEQDYFKTARKDPAYIYFRFKSGSSDDLRIPEESTKIQIAVITHFEYFTPVDDRTFVKVVAIDPPSYFLNMGDASGKSYQGRIDQVIKKVVNQYAPQIEFDMKPTKDNELNRHYMMRQDAKTFIMSLLEWSAPFNNTKTHWLIGVDGFKMNISDQGSLTPVNRGYYKRYAEGTHDMIVEAHTESNNALKLASVKMYSAGASSTHGDYFDKINDPKELKTVVKDSTTDGKTIPYIDEYYSYKKPSDAPNDGPPKIGSTYVTPIPEYFSSGDIGVDYEDYIDGRARTDYLTLLHSVVKSKIKVVGHGEFIDTRGLGVDTVFINWKKATDEHDNELNFWMFGHWTVYGFRHKLYAGAWSTELYISRPDEDVVGTKARPLKFNVQETSQI